MTELQNKKDGGPILIDLDFRFDKSITERILEDDMISDMVDSYAEEIIKLFNLQFDRYFFCK